MAKHVVLDSSNLDAIVADATGEGLDAPKEIQPAGAAEGAKDTAVPAKSDAAKPAERAEDSGNADDADDIEGEDGLTPRQKRDLTQKMQVAIGKKHRALKDAEEFAAEQYNEKRLAEQRAEAQQREIDRLKQQLAGQKPAEPDKPKRENFETQEAFDDAVTDWKVDQKFKAKDAEREAKAHAERQAQIMADAKARISKAMDLVPDFAEVTEAVDIEVPPYIAGYMQESEMLAELGYHFAKHPEELERLQKMAPARALVEVGKIESRLQPFSAAADGTAAEKVTKDNGATPSVKPSTETAPAGGTTPEKPSKPRAAAPIKPLSSGSAVQVEKPASERTLQEEMAAWQRKRQLNLTRRQRH